MYIYIQNYFKIENHNVQLQTVIYNKKKIY